MNGSIRIFVINLRRSTGRREAISRQLNALGIPFDFFDAVDGATVGEDALELADLPRIRERLRREMSPGEIGCALSHAFLYEKIVKENIDHAIILEDDAILGEDFASLVGSGALEGSSYRLVLLHCRYPMAMKWRATHFGPGKRKMYRLLGPASGAAAYYLRLSTARRLFERVLPVSYVADWPCPIHLWQGTRCLHPFVVMTPPDEAHQSTMHQWENIRTATPCNPTPREIFSRKVTRLLSLAVFPCLLWPSVFGDLEDLQMYLLGLTTGVVSRLGGAVALPWKLNVELGSSPPAVNTTTGSSV